MTRYQIVKENVERVMDFRGDPIFHPKYQCVDCGHVINPSFVSTTEKCGFCYEGVNNIGEYLDRIHAVTFYASQSAFEDHMFTNSIDDVKRGQYTTDMAELLIWGMKQFGQIENVDYILPPPRGDESASVNHMKKIGEELSDQSDIPVKDPLRKSENYTSQKGISNSQQRYENVKNNIESINEFDNDPTILVIDDVATSCGTLKYSAKALLETGADRVTGLVISRSETLDRLEKADIYTPEND